VSIVYDLVEYIMDIWYILCTFGYLVAIWYVFSPIWVNCVKKKSGNPAGGSFLKQVFESTFYCETTGLTLDR
jgi:hypothetical protein